MIETFEEYESKISKTFANLDRQNFTDIENSYRKDFLFFKTILNVFFLEQYSNEELTNLFKKFLLQKEITIIDRETDIKLLFDTISIKSESHSLQPNIPTIYCSFHFGSFITAIPYLINKGVDLFVVSKNEYLINELTAYDKMSSHAEDKIKSIKNDDWSSLINISNKLKEGKSVFVYIDRIEGLNMATKEKLYKLKFLQHEILIRRGIPEISYIRNAPIVSVICFRKSISEIELSFKDHLMPQHASNKNDYINLITKELFDVFELYIINNPEQWDYWLDIFHQLDLKKLNKKEINSGIEKIKKLLGFQNTDSDPSINLESVNDDALFAFNDDDYGIYMENDFFHLLSLKSFACFKISINLNQILNTINSTPISFGKLKNIINHSLLNELVAKKIIYPQ